MEEKSPLRIAAGSVVMIAGLVWRELYSSKFDMKNSRFFPLNSFGMPYRSPQLVTVLILLVGRLHRRRIGRSARGRGEVVRHGVELVVAQELPQGSVVFIGAGFGGGVDLPKFPAELRGIDPGLDLEFL